MKSERAFDRIQRTGVDAYGNPAETRELFDTPPGPRAMTAQAGAVAFRYSYEVARGVYAETRWLGMDELHHYGESGDLVKGPSPHWQRVEYAYTTPPAAVPVEALEGLVGRLNALEEYADEARVAYAGDHSSGTFRRIAERTQGIRDELTQLIKERSNG